MKVMTAARLAVKKFITLVFSGDWEALLGNPEKNFSMFVFGKSGNGKTNFCILLAKYLTKFGKVLYYTIEEGANLSMQYTLIRQGLMTEKKVFIGEYEPEKYDSPLDDLIATLKKRNSPQFIFIDSLDYADIDNRQIKILKRLFPRKSFIAIGRANNNNKVIGKGIKAYYDLGMVINIADFIAYNEKPRYGGGEPFEIKKVS